MNDGYSQNRYTVRGTTDANGVGYADGQNGPVVHASASVSGDVPWHTSHDYPVCGWSAPADRTSADAGTVTCLDCIAALPSLAEVLADAVRSTRANRVSPVIFLDDSLTEDELSDANRALREMLTDGTP